MKCLSIRDNQLQFTIMVKIFMYSKIIENYYKHNNK